MYATHFLINTTFLIQVFFSLSLDQSNNSEFLTDDELINQIPVIKDAALGVWNYTMTNADPPYREGVLFVTKHTGTYDVAIKLSNGLLSGNDVIVENERIKFNVNIAGLERVSFVLLVKGDGIMGESYSVKGSSQISGIRQLPER